MDLNIIRLITKYKTEVEILVPGFIGGQNWKLTNLNGITVLFGKNGSGKSVLLRQLRDTSHETIHYIIPERTGNLTFEASYLAQETSSEQRRAHSTTNFIDGYRQRIITRIQGYFLSRGAARVEKLPGNPEELESLLKLLLADFEITLRGETPPYIIKRLSNGQEVTDISQLSSGEAQLLTIALDILTIGAMWDIQNKDCRILLIDEPDAHLHPDLQVRLADFIMLVANKFKIQVIISTHSTTLLSALGQFGKESCSVIYLSRQKRDFQAEIFSENLKQLSACLGGHLLMGPLFGSPLLLVEGDDDYRVWSQVPRGGFLNLAVLPSNGEEIKIYQKLLEKIFASISEIKLMGHALLDGDKGLPIANEYNTQNYIKYIKLNCHECENLFLCDEILADLGITWDQAKEKLNQNADQYGNKAGQIKAVSNCDKRSIDIKLVINEISKILDSKNVHWTTRIGNKLGKGKPSGQLADFLGEQVVNSIWTQ